MHALMIMYPRPDEPAKVSAKNSTEMEVPVTMRRAVKQLGRAAGMTVSLIMSRSDAPMERMVRCIRLADREPATDSPGEGGDVPRGIQVGVQREPALDAGELPSFSIAPRYSYNPNQERPGTLVEHRDRLNDIGSALHAYLDGAKHSVSGRTFGHYLISIAFIL